MNALRARRLWILADVLLTLVMLTQASYAQTARIPTVGLLWGPALNLSEYLKEGMRELGYVEGRNIRFEYRAGEYTSARLAKDAADLAALKVDVIVAFAPGAAVAAKNATGRTPIVFMAIGDPLASGLVTSLAHPGGNLTGTTRMLTEMSAKNLELLKEAVPALSRVVVLWNPTNTSHVPALKAVENAAATLSVSLHPIEVRQATDLDHAFAAIARERADALLPLADPVFFVPHLQRIVDFAASRHLATATNWTELPEAGGLLGYTTSIPDESRLAAKYVDKILRGAKPGDIPVERPTKFELVINARTAAALGLTIPQVVLQRADRVIR